MSNIIPYPRVGRRQSIANPVVNSIHQGEFVNAIHFIWNKFSLSNGINLAGFRHNLRDYYDETAVMTRYELETIRGLLSDPELQICVSPAGNTFRLDNRGTPVDRKTIFIDEALFFLFSSAQTESQINALRLIFMATLIHCLGDYITTWTQPQVDFTTTTNVHRFEGGTKTEYAYFGGIIGGHMTDGIHYEYAKIRLFNAANHSVHWIIPDLVAREYYNSDQILKFSDVGLTRNPVTTGPINTIRQLDICCGWHRLVWKPIHRPPPPPPSHDPQAANPQPSFFNQQHTGSQWYPPQPQAPQTGFMSYGAAPGTTYAPQPAFPPPSANFGGASYAPPPPPMGGI